MIWDMHEYLIARATREKRTFANLLRFIIDAERECEMAEAGKAKRAA
jgi:hypothetical protein